MCKNLVTIVAASMLMVGCSKHAAPEPTAAVPESVDKAPPVSTNDNPLIAGSLEELNKQVQQQQYEAAVGAIMSMAHMPKSDKQEAQFRARLRETETALLQKAQAGDAAAQQSAAMLGRMMTGR